MLKTQQNPTRPFLKTVLKRIFMVVKLVTYNFAVSRALIISVSRNLNAKWQKRTDVHINTGVLISPDPDQEGNKLMFLPEWREFPSAPCLAGGGGDLMTARVSMLLKSAASLTFFRACFLPGGAKDLSAPQQCALFEMC